MKKINPRFGNKTIIASYVGCLILTSDKRLLLQKRGLDWDRFPNCLALFGGKINVDEQPMEALRRELHEELGAIVEYSHVLYLGSVTEKNNGQDEWVYEFFWYDKDNTIKKCYEGEAIYFKKRFRHFE